MTWPSGEELELKRRWGEKRRFQANIPQSTWSQEGEDTENNKKNRIHRNESTLLSVRPACA